MCFLILHGIIFRKSPKSTEKEKVGKKPRVWDLGGTNKDLENLERTLDKPEDIKSHYTPDTEVSFIILLLHSYFLSLDCRANERCDKRFRSGVIFRR